MWGWWSMRGWHPLCAWVTVLALAALVVAVPDRASGTGGFSAEFFDVPSTHDGSVFELGLRFVGAELAVSYLTLRDNAFRVEGASVRGARRVAPGSDTQWTITVEPDEGHLGDVVVRLPTRPCADAGAICSKDGAPLAESVEVTVAGPHSLTAVTVGDTIRGVAFALQSASTARSVAENTAAGHDIGAPVTVADSSGTVTYSLGGADSGSFDIVAATGQLRTRAALDYETNSRYEVTVTATDSESSTDIAVTIDVINVTELLSAVTGPTEVTFAENDATRVATYTASSPEDAGGVAWSSSGADRGAFSIEGGVLRFLALPDYESPADADTNGAYALTVTASDGTGSVSLAATVTVADQNEAGTLNLGSLRPRLGEALTAGVSDPDGDVVDITWTWERSAGRNAWTEIGAATSASHTPAAADAGQYLRVSATYTDGHGAGQTAQAVTPNVVTAQLLSGLTATTSDSANSVGDAFPRVMKPAFDAETLHYAVGCTDDGDLYTPADDTMTLTAWAAPGARLAVNGVQVESGSPIDVPVHVDSVVESGNPIDVLVHAESDVEIAVTGGDGASTTYVVHCLAGDLGNTTATRAAGATGVIEDLIMFTRGSYLAIVDNNAVPRFHRKIDGQAGGHFRVHRAGNDLEYRYSYTGPSAWIRHRRGWVVLDENLKILHGSGVFAATVDPLATTDLHDFRVLENGNYLLMAYEPAMRDLSGLTFEHPSVDSVQPQQIKDSAIQIVTPGLFPRAVFTWNSWGNIPLEDCAQHRFPDGYAHINSLQMVHGHIIASFRGCSTVLRIDPDHPAEHKVVWRVGRSNLSDAEWEARDIGPPPLAVVNDPEGEFCGQHAAEILPNGNLIMFDNGAVCLKDPWEDAELGRQSSVYSRAVEYAIDEANGEAVFLRDHSLYGRKEFYGNVRGHVEALNNGDWLISWGGTRGFSYGAGPPYPPDESVTQVDPDTGEEKFSLRMPYDGGQLSVHAIPLAPHALAPQPGALTADLPASSHTSVFNLGAPQVVVAFSRPVVDFAADTPSVSVEGATVAGVSPHVAAGEPANAYLVTLTPEGDGAITFRLVADQACADSGICTADGTTLSEAPPALVIGPPVTVSFEQATYTIAEGATLAVTVRLSAAHHGVRGVTFPVLAGAGSSGSSDDLTVAGSVTFDAGETRKTLTVEAVHDYLVEGPETATLEFGALPYGVTADSTAAPTVTISDADRAQISFTAAVHQVAEGAETSLVFAITNGVTFEHDQTINLTVGGTATPGDDFVLVDAGNRILSPPYAITLPAGADAVKATIRAVDDTVIETTGETVTVSARLDLTNASLGTRTVTIPPSDVEGTPLVTIAAGGTITEGENATFALTRTDAHSLPLTTALTVRVQVTATGSTLSGSTPTTATFEQNSATAVLDVATLDDTVIEDDAAVTVLVLGSTSSPPVYLTGTANAAAVTVYNDDYVADFSVSPGSSEVAEGRSVRVVVETVGVTFADPQTLELALSGTATPVDDFTITNSRSQDLTSSQRLILAAGARSASFTLRAATDTEEDPDETIEVSIFHGAYSIGVVAVTITEPAPRPGGGGGGGGGTGGGGGGPAAVVEIGGASYTAADTETVFTAAISDGTRIRALRWTVTGPHGFTATSDAQRFAFVAPADGTYTVSVTVGDIARRTLTGSATLTV